MKTFKAYLAENIKSIKVFYHNDADGFGSAYAYWKKFKETAKYLAVDHGMKLPIKKGEVIYMLDYSIKPSDMIKAANIAEKIIVIDHHKGALQEFSKVKLPDNVELNYDIKKSGAMLTWNFFHKSKAPKIIEYIQDYDIWTLKLPNIKEVSIWIKENIKDFRQLDKIPPMNVIVKEGSKLLNKQNNEIDQLLKSLKKVNFEGYKTGVVKSDDHTSEIGNKIVNMGYDIGIVYKEDSENKNNWAYGIRSKGDLDVSVLARRYGGNGHSNASGFSQPKNVKIWK